MVGSGYTCTRAWWPPHHSQPTDVALACEEKNSATVAMLAARVRSLRCCWQRPAPVGRPASPPLGTCAKVACCAAGKPAGGSSKPAGAPKAAGASKAAKPAAAAAKQPAKQTAATPAAAQDDKSGLCLIVGLGNPGKERGTVFCSVGDAKGLQRRCSGSLHCRSSAVEHPELTRAEPALSGCYIPCATALGTVTRHCLRTLMLHLGPHRQQL